MYYNIKKVKREARRKLALKTKSKLLELKVDELLASLGITEEQAKEMMASRGKQPEPTSDSPVAT